MQRERQLRVRAPRARAAALPQHDPDGTGRRAEWHPAVDELQAVAQRLGVRDRDPDERQGAEHEQDDAGHASATATGDEPRDDAPSPPRRPRTARAARRARRSSRPSAACAPARWRRRRRSGCRPGTGSRTAGRRRRWRGPAGRRPGAGSPRPGAATSAASRHGAALACRRTSSHATDGDGRRDHVLGLRQRAEAGGRADREQPAATRGSDRRLRHGEQQPEQRQRAQRRRDGVRQDVREVGRDERDGRDQRGRQEGAERARVLPRQEVGPGEDQRRDDDAERDLGPKPSPPMSTATAASAGPSGP